MLGFQGGVSIPLVKGGVKAPPAKRQCRAGPKAGARRGFTYTRHFTWFWGPGNYPQSWGTQPQKPHDLHAGANRDRRAFQHAARTMVTAERSWWYTPHC